MAKSAELTAELNTLLRMTHVETWTTRGRRAQARDDKVERELSQQVESSRKRASDIRDAIADIGGTEDLVGILVSRTAALARYPYDQSQSLQSALLDDLTLQHSLRERAMVARHRAESEDRRRVAGMLERVEQDHTETIGWIKGVLADLASGQEAPLEPTRAQSVAGTMRRASWSAAVLSARALNRSADRLRRGGDKASERTRKGARDAAHAVEAGVDEARAEFDQGSQGAAGVPIRNYDELTAADAAAAVHRLERRADVRAVLRHEKATKDRRTVVTAAEERLERLDRDPAHA